jgi:hypothetical protein
VRSIFDTKVMYDREEGQTQCPQIIFREVKVPIFLNLRSFIKISAKITMAFSNFNALHDLGNFSH